MNDTNLTIRPMTIDDFEQVHSLWMEIHGFGIRSIDDSKEGVERFIRRNPTTSMVAVCDGKIVGAILCGHDGRRAGLYHVCVQENYRKHGIGQKLVERCLEALKAEKISKVNLIAFIAMTETESPRILSLRGAERRGNPSPNSYLIPPNS